MLYNPFGEIYELCDSRGKRISFLIKLDEDGRVHFFGMQRVLGTGACSTVCESLHVTSAKITNCVAVVKLVKECDSKAKVDQGILQVCRSVNVLRHLALPMPHPFIESAPLMTIADCGYAAECYTGGDVIDLANKPFSELPGTTRIKWAKQAVKGLEEIHHRQVIHRDLKLDNMMIDSQGNLRIIDFGFSKLTSEPNDRIQLFNNFVHYENRKWNATSKTDEEFNEAWRSSDHYSLMFALFGLLTRQPICQNVVIEGHSCPAIFHRPASLILQKTGYSKFVGETFDRFFKYEPKQRPNMEQLTMMFDELDESDWTMPVQQVAQSTAAKRTKST